MSDKEIFDEWPERYEDWFRTPIGALVRRTEWELVASMLEPRPGELVLDAGCGTGVFTTDILSAGARVVGLDISAPMLGYALKKTAGSPFDAVRADMRRLPLRDNAFDRAVSITALEFVEDARGAVDELFRVTKPGGRVVVATLNSLSPWAERRRNKTQAGQRHILESAFFRSPAELLAFSPHPGTAATAVHFSKDEDPAQAVEIEKDGQSRRLDTGAFVAVRWERPA